MNNSVEERLKEAHKRFTTAKDLCKDYDNYQRSIRLVSDCFVNQRIDRDRIIAFINEMTSEYKELIEICSLGNVKVERINSDGCNDETLFQQLCYLRDNILYFGFFKTMMNMSG